MHRVAIFFGLALAGFSAVSTPAATRKISGEGKQVCEVKPVMRCLDKSKLEGATLNIPAQDAAIASDGFAICDSSYNYTTSPDIVLIMDNTRSMDSLQTVNGVPRWCQYPDKEISDPGCISGDPHRLRGPALKTFVDSALAKGGKGVNIGVVTFSEGADAKSVKLVPLNASTVQGIKDSIVMSEDGETNYTAAFRAAMGLLATSHKPKKEQFIIFVSDGRPDYPTRPDGDPYTYKTKTPGDSLALWDSLPTVHSIFLGDNSSNYKDMQDISSRTGGFFFHITDVSQLAKILTDDISKNLFRRAVPTRTTVRNNTDTISFSLDSASHVAQPDSGAYTLLMPGPLFLKPGLNDIVVGTEYGYGGTTHDVHFKINRGATDSLFPNLVEACRDMPKLILYNANDEKVNLLGLPFTIKDSLLRYSLTTSAPGLDSFDVVIRTQTAQTAQQDLETVGNGPGNRKDSTWSGSEPFQHLTVQKKPGDRQIQVEHGDYVIVTYANPYLREDSVSVKVRIKYGPDLDQAAFWDLDGDGQIETVDIKYLEALSGLPYQLQFHITDATGNRWERTAKVTSNEIRFALKSDSTPDRSHLIVTLATPFPYGVSSVAMPDTSGRTFRQVELPMADGTFRVDDSLPPVIADAQVLPADDSHSLLRILLTFSEPLKLRDNSLQPIVIKRDTAIFTTKQMPIDHFEKIDDLHYTLYLSASADFKPVGGDSAAINTNGDIRDLFGRGPTRLTFAPLGGAAPTQTISDFYVTFANGSKSNPVGAPPTGETEHTFIPVDSKGYALPGSDNGKCGTCTALDGDLFTGSVIYVITKHPVNYQFSVYSNFGQIVAKGSGKVEAADLKLLEKIEDPTHDPNQTRYIQRIVWNGRTLSKEMAGTGAYILRAVFKYDRSFETGARSSLDSKYTTFGFLRQCCQSSGGDWNLNFSIGAR